MLAKIISAVISGISAGKIEVEVNVGSSGFPRMTIVGLPDASVKESRERVNTALRNSGYDIPPTSITVNLAPADIKKEGAIYDLPIALGILFGSEQLPMRADLAQAAILGELALDGKIRPVKGLLPIAQMLADCGIKSMIVPEENASEAAVVEKLEVYPVRTLEEAVGFLSNQLAIVPKKVDFDEVFKERFPSDLDFSEVRGQPQVKRALALAAAGGHNVLMVGPPGTGKTMLAKRLPTILPPLTIAESLETTKIYSVRGLLKNGQTLITERPFRDPHHTTSEAGLIGGGIGNPSPGELSLAHNGVLFLDELPEFSSKVLSALRQPLESGFITIGRSETTATFPANIMLIAAMNPCPCGYYTHPEKVCRCSPMQVDKYMGRVSGPLLDRIDIHVEVSPITYETLTSAGESEGSKAIRAKVLGARKRQAARFKNDKILTNSQMTNRMIRKYCKVTPESEGLLKEAMESLKLSARAYWRILKIARTLADYEDCDEISTNHVIEAIGYRNLDRALFV